MTLVAEDIEAVAAAVAKRFPDPWQARSPFVSRDEAMKFARFTSLRSWQRFCAVQKLKALPGGGYARLEVERAARRQLRAERGIIA